MLFSEIMTLNSLLISHPSLAEPKGVVYTKAWVVNLLLDLAGYCPKRNLVDLVAIEPAAGDGAFLGSMIKRLLESCQRQGRSIEECVSSLIGYELSETSANRTRAMAFRILTEGGVKQSVAEHLAGSWVRNSDYLLEVHSAADFVIGNPPYVRLEDLPEDTAALYRRTYITMRGRADLYVAFFEAALRQLKKDGVCAFICADRWMRNQYGSDLRRLVTSAYSVDVVMEMHDADAFHDEVDAYPAITLIRRKRQGPVVIAAASKAAEINESHTLCDSLEQIICKELTTLPEGLNAARLDTWFEGDEPWPCSSPKQLALLRKLETQFPPLESGSKRTVVGIGVATGIDEVFITKDPNLVEPSRLVRLAVARDICDGKMNWSGNYLVDPWEKSGLADLTRFPRLRLYFEQNAALIKKRNTAKKNPHAWYRTIDRVNHALIGAPKLYIADIKNYLNPVLDLGETYPHHNLYFIQSNEWDLEVLGGLLISSIGQFFVESYGVRMRGGYFRFQAQYLRRIRVPDPKTISKVDRESLRKAFQLRDRPSATRIALGIYGIEEKEMDIAL